MNNKKMILALSAFMLLSHEMRASARNFIIGTLIVAYIHENVITKQDLTKLPEVSVNDVQEYNNKVVMTIANTYTSLKNLSTEVQEYFMPKSSSVSKKDNIQANNPSIDIKDSSKAATLPVVHNDPAKDQLEKRHD